MESITTEGISKQMKLSERQKLLLERFLKIRTFSEKLCDSLKTEDYVVQPVVDVSPPKWHLAHTTWFFEELILKARKGYSEFHPDFSYFFNSYYESVGERVLRPERGFMTRPEVQEIYKYRVYVDQEMSELLSNEPLDSSVLDMVELGLNHEQQHQELLLTDIKYILGHNPLFPAYTKQKQGKNENVNADFKWLSIEEGVYEIGHKGKGFCYDNELGSHKQYLQPFKAMNRLVTNVEYLEFIKDGGYDHFQWWLSEAWDWVNQLKTKAPLYWHFIDGEWNYYTLSGLVKVDLNAPVTHISYFEADAYARWKELRLLTEFEWEVLADKYGNLSETGFVDNENFHPSGFNGTDNQLVGFTWEWTQSAYLPYPGFKIAEGAVGEYNGKFMINQMVLRGGSCVTTMDHFRTTYRNFFHPHLRWQFTGIRLADLQ